MTALSVVIPTFNTAQMTLHCCRAVLASLPPGSEAILPPSIGGHGNRGVRMRICMTTKHDRREVQEVGIHLRIMMR